MRRNGAPPTLGRLTLRERAAGQFRPSRSAGADANRAARGARPAWAKISARHRRQKNLDRKILIASVNPSSAKRDRRRDRGSGNPGGGTRGQSRASKHLNNGAAHRLKHRGARYSNASPPSWIAAVSNFPPWKFSKSAKPGRKPMATSARRWISVFSTRSKCARIGRPRLTQHVLGEESYQHYWPRGVALVIAPWNFPMAILCRHGLGRARHRQHRHHETGGAISRLRRDVDGNVRGSGSAAGRAQFPARARVRHRRSIWSIITEVEMIAFTGSREVGLRIWESAGQNTPGPARIEARRLRNGRQERGHRRFRRRSR